MWASSAAPRRADPANGIPANRVEASFAPDGQDFGPPQLIGAFEGLREPAVAFDDRGAAVVAWARYESGVAAAVKARGASFETPRTLTTNASSDVSVAGGGRGTSAVTWETGAGIIRIALRLPG